MAINFLNNVSLNKAQLENARVQNLAGDPDIVGTVAQKQATLGLIYFKSNGSQTQGIRVFTQTAFESGAETFSWVDVGGAITLTGAVTGTGSGSIATTLSDNAVVTDTINNAAVTASKIGASAVTTTKINDSAVTTAKINNLAVTAAKLATGSTTEGITTGKINTNTLITSSDDFVTGASADATIPTTKAVKKYVDEVTTGTLLYQGSFNADTGALTSGPGSGTTPPSKLYDTTPTPPQTAIEIPQNGFYIVSEPGNFFGYSSIPLTNGDYIVNATSGDIASGTDVSEAYATDNFTIVQADRDVATATTIGVGNTTTGTTSGLTVNYSSDNPGSADILLNVSSLGAGSGAPTTLVGTNSSGATKEFTESDVHSARGKYLELNAGSVTGVARAVSGGITTYTITLATAWVDISGLKVSVEVVKITGGETVYAQVNRTAAIITVKFIGTVLDDQYYVLLQNVA
tara:strand:- start:160 stop:1542 length:1383 start_codon:yes stop_codon:yes gene_type:complete